jgi:hypothetical protein
MLADDPWLPTALEYQWSQLHAWWSRQPGVRACRGVPNTDPVLRTLGGDMHTNCCVQPLMLTLPEGETVESMLTRYADQAPPGTARHVAEYCLTEWRRWDRKVKQRDTSDSRYFRDRWRRNRSFWKRLAAQ